MLGNSIGKRNCNLSDTFVAYVFHSAFYHWAFYVTIIKWHSRFGESGHSKLHPLDKITENVSLSRKVHVDRRAGGASIVGVIRGVALLCETSCL